MLSSFKITSYKIHEAFSRSTYAWFTDALESLEGLKLPRALGEWGLSKDRLLNFVFTTLSASGQIFREAPYFKQPPCCNPKPVFRVESSNFQFFICEFVKARL